MCGPGRKGCHGGVGGVLDPQYDLVTSESPSLLPPSGLSCQGSDLETRVQMCAFDTHPTPNPHQFT